MGTRHIAAAAVAVLAVAGCSTPEPALGGTTATVTIDGQNTGTHPVRCHQTGFTWYIETPDQKQGFKAVLETGVDVEVKTVDFRDFGGFSGSFWVDHRGKAEVSGNGGEYTITGTADGNFSDTPSDATTAQFRIEADC